MPWLASSIVFGLWMLNINSLPLLYPYFSKYSLGIILYLGVYDSIASSTIFWKWELVIPSILYSGIIPSLYSLLKNTLVARIVLYSLSYVPTITISFPTFNTFFRYTILKATTLNIIPSIETLNETLVAVFSFWRRTSSYTSPQTFISE